MSTIIEKLNEILAIKNNIKYAIRDKGIDIPDYTPFAEYPNYIRNISGGGNNSGDSGGGEVRQIARLASINDTPVTASDVQGQSGDFREETFVNGDGDTITIISDSATLSRLRFNGNQNLGTVFFIDPTALTDMGSMFAGCQNLTWVNANNWDFSNIDSTKEMFMECFGLTNLDLSGVSNTSNVRYMNFMFGGCRNLETLDISYFDISEEATCDGILQGCTALRELRLDNCSRNTIIKIINSSNFPTGTVNGQNRVIYCRGENAENLTAPDGWEFSLR